MWHEDTSVVSKYAASLRLLKCNYAGNMLVAISDYDNEIIHSARRSWGRRRCGAVLEHLATWLLKLALAPGLEQPVASCHL